MTDTTYFSQHITHETMEQDTEKWTIKNWYQFIMHEGKTSSTRNRNPLAIVKNCIEENEMPLDLCPSLKVYAFSRQTHVQKMIIFVQIPLGIIALIALWLGMWYIHNVYISLLASIIVIALLVALVEEYAGNRPVRNAIIHYCSRLHNNTIPGRKKNL